MANIEDVKLLGLEPSNKFVMFGCWNNLRNKNSGLEKTMNALNRYLIENKIDFIANAGDNYYPDKSQKEENKAKEEKKAKKEEETTVKKDKTKKDKKKETPDKRIIIKDLMDGFNMLPKDIPIKMILGNHDLETNKPDKRSYTLQYLKDDISALEPDGECAILKAEKNIIYDSNNITFGIHHEKVVNNTLVLMIDTSLYDEVDVVDFEVCYRVAVEKQTNIENLRLDQSAFIHGQISANPGIQNIIIIGHHPITGYKKKGEVKLTSIFPLFINELEAIVQHRADQLRDKQHRANQQQADQQQANQQQANQQQTLTYLCADLHLFQEGIVTLPSGAEIHQLIVGTGGTAIEDTYAHSEILSSVERDVDVEHVDIMPVKKVSYKMIGENIFAHGFLVCDCSGFKPIFTFMQSDAILAAADVVGGNKKTKNKKTKRQRTKKRQKTKRQKTKRQNQKAKQTMRRRRTRM